MPAIGAAPLSAEIFDPGLVLHPRVDRSVSATVGVVKYSVTARLIGRRVRVRYAPLAGPRSVALSWVETFMGFRAVATVNIA